MIYPLISEYTEAILSAEDNLNELTHLRPVLDENGHPIMSSGNFAVVYKMQDINTGKYYAVKCFTREQMNRRETYKEISEYISSIYNSYGHNYIISVQYIEKELYVDSSQTNDTEFPILLMDWIDGRGLEEYIEENIANEDKLIKIYEEFEGFINWLLPSHLSHGDLKPDNIIISNKGEIVLIDYDGMFVPKMLGQESPEMGTPQFQYEYRKETDFNEYVDDYAAMYLLLILKLITLEKHPLSFYLKKDKQELIAYTSQFASDVSVSKLLSAYIFINAVGFIDRESLNNIIFDERKRNRYLELRLISEALGGNTQAMIQLGDTYSEGKFTPGDSYKAFEWYSIAKLVGDCNATCGMCRNFYHINNDYFRPRDFCKNPIHVSFCNNSVEFALCREAEMNIIKHKEHAVKYFEKAMALNFAPAIYWLGISSRLGKKDINLVKEAARLKYNEANKTLGDYYKKGEHVAQSNKESLNQYQIAANLGNKEAQYIIGMAFYNGWEDFPVNFPEAIKWLTKSAEQGHTPAVYRLFLCYCYGKGVEKDYSKAYLILNWNHDTTDKDILRLLGYCYEYGIGTQINYKKSFEYYLKAVHSWEGCSWAEQRIERLCEERNLVDETSVNEKELPNMPRGTHTGLYSSDERRFLQYYGTYGDEFVVDEGCEVLCDYSFNDLYSECDGHYLTHLTLPESLKRIGNNVFCASIEKITCQSIHFKIEDGFLLSCDGQTLIRYYGKSRNITIPPSVRYIKGGAFSEKEIEHIEISSDIIYIGSNPFARQGIRYKNDNTSKIKITVSNDNYKLIDDALYSTYENRLIVYLGDSPYFKVIDGTEVIGENAFINANLDILLLPASIRKIHESAFYFCNLSMKKVYIPRGMTTHFMDILPEYVINNTVIEER